MRIRADRSAHVVSGLIVAGLLSLGSLACGGTSPGARAADQAIGISTSQLFVTIENRAGTALMDVKVNIVPVGRATTFTATWNRMELGEKHEFSLREFRGRDGTPLNLRVHRPQSVLVTATDVNQKAYEVQSPW